MNKKNQSDVIDLREVIAIVWKRKKVFYKVLPTVFVLSCLYIICIPRYYTTSTTMAPEIGNAMNSGGSLGSIASSFGIDITGVQTSDAITPLLYPDLMEDNQFVSNLLKIKVKSQDGDINTDYYTYLKKLQQYPWWHVPINWVKSLFSEEESKGASNNLLESPYFVTEKEEAILFKVRKNISLDVDKKTGVITITATAQDAQICKMLADSTRSYLQRFITDYRTNKARIDLEYYEQLTTKAKHDYEKARQLYGSYADANTEVILQSFRSKQDDLENDMQLKFNTYSVLNTQLQQAKAKVQERTPAFTVIKGAQVPVKPSGPKRMFFVLGMLVLATFGITVYTLKDNIKAAVIKPEKNEA